MVDGELFKWVQYIACAIVKTKLKIQLKIIKILTALTVSERVSDFFGLFASN
jgi:hypothetical protein